MGFSSMKKIVVLLSLWSIMLVEGDNLRRHQVYILSQLPNESEPLIAHCRSKNDDLGSRTLHSGESFDWDFRTDFFETTLYSCDFQWGSHTKGMVVFSADWPYTHTYNYVVRPDGFYVGHSPKNSQNDLVLSQQWD